MISIVTVKYGSDCVSLGLDNGETLKIPFTVAGLYSLEAGRVMEGEEYAQLSNESQRYRCRVMALDYLAICPRSALEMERYLGRKRFDHDLVRETVAGLADAGYIDDADYATRFIDNKLRKKLVGKQLLSRELQKRGIARPIINQALKESETLLGDPEAVYLLARKKYDLIKHKKNGIAKLSYFLHSRGFDTDTVSGVIERILREEGGGE